MNCIVCNTELKSTARIEDATISVHEGCLNNGIIEAVKEVLKGYLYHKNGNLVRGYFHKQHKII
jgi:hypothetical protein